MRNRRERYRPRHFPDPATEELASRITDAIVSGAAVMDGIRRTGRLVVWSLVGMALGLCGTVIVGTLALVLYTVDGWK